MQPKLKSKHLADQRPSLPQSREEHREKTRSGTGKSCSKWVILTISNTEPQRKDRITEIARCGIRIPLPAPRAAWRTALGPLLRFLPSHGQGQADASPVALRQSGPVWWWCQALGWPGWFPLPGLSPVWPTDAVNIKRQSLLSQQSSSMTLRQLRSILRSMDNACAHKKLPHVSTAFLLQHLPATALSHQRLSAATFKGLNHHFKNTFQSSNLVCPGRFCAQLGFQLPLTGHAPPM